MLAFWCPVGGHRPGHFFIKGGLALIYASFLTETHPIIHVTRPIISRELRCSLVLTGGVHYVTSGVRVGFLNLSKRFTAAIKDLTGIIGGVRH